LAELEPALYSNTSIKVLDISRNGLNDIVSAEILRDIFSSNKTMTALDLSVNIFGPIAGVVECIAEGLCSNSTLMEINLSRCHLEDGGVSTLGRNLGSRNTTLQKLTLSLNFMTSTGAGVLLETMEQNSHITDLDLENNALGNEGASLLARSLGNKASPNLTRLSLYDCNIGDDGFIALVSALEQNTSLLHLDLRSNWDVSERVFWTLAESLPEINVLQRLDFDWRPGLTSAMPLLLQGLRNNTSLFRIHVANCATELVPPTTEKRLDALVAGCRKWNILAYRNSFRSLIRAPTERLLPRGIWPDALSRVATLPDVIFEVLRSKPSLVPSEDTEGKEAAKDTCVARKCKCGDE
jgi:hypothetical protein